MSFLAALKWLPVAALLFSSLFEARARSHAKSEWAPRGRLVQLADGHRLQLDCRGSGSPTVVLESGLDHLGSLAWGIVPDSLSQTSRVCTYSRAGLLWSDRKRGAFDSRRNAQDLHAVLTAAQETGPWVLVGHSVGVPYVTMFATMYPGEIAGLVFVDGTHPEQFSRWKRVSGRDLQPSATIPRIGAGLSWTGLLRALPVDQVPATWPRETAGAPADYLPVSVSAMASEIAALPKTLQRAGEQRNLAALPLIVLAAENTLSEEEAKMMGVQPAQMQAIRHATYEMRVEQAAWSTRGRLITAAGSSHYVQFDRPEIVIQAIRTVVSEARLDRRQLSVGAQDAFESQVRD